MGFKNWITPPQIDLPLGDTGKNFVIPGDAIANTARKTLQKLGFVTPFGPEYFDDIPIGVSIFGTLVFDNLVIPDGRYTQLSPLGEIEVVGYSGITIDTIVFEASQQKNIVKTEIAGRDGAVKEYISSNDTAITMRGAIVNSFNLAYPRTEVANFINILKIPQQIRVESKFLNDILGFEFITIENWNLVTTPGMRNVQAFTLTAVNDVSPEIDEKYGTV